jgi:hypothetical protein
MQNWVMVHNLRLKYLHMKKSIIHNFIFLTTKRQSNNILEEIVRHFYGLLSALESRGFSNFSSILFYNLLLLPSFQV